jgi:hypothetical protein
MRNELIGITTVVFGYTAQATMDVIAVIMEAFL